MKNKSHPLMNSTNEGNRYHTGGFYDDGKVAEIGYDGSKRYFICFDQKTQQVSHLDQIQMEGVILSPYHQERDELVENPHPIVLVPEEVEDYGTLDDLIIEVASFIDKYVEVEEDFLYVSVAYTLFTYRYDELSNLGYIRVIGEFESGKSRYLMTVGQLCYLPSIFSTLPTDASIFRVLERYPGTLIFDEGDRDFTDTNSIFTKILNSGYQQQGGIIRCTGSGFRPQSFNCFSPKMFASRFNYDDPALESRLISYKTYPKTRKNIPLLLGPEFSDEQKTLRQKLMMYRLKNLGSGFQDVVPIPTISSRKNQIFLSIAQVVPPVLHEYLASYLTKAYAEELRHRATQGPQAEILSIISSKCKVDGDKLYFNELERKYNADRDQEKLSAKKLGGILREMNLSIVNGTGNKTCYEHNQIQYKAACKKYGVDLQS